MKTKFGNAKLNPHGYYMISTGKEGNGGKFLHRLIYEDHHKVCLLDGVVIHHKDGNKINNSIENLEPMFNSDHTSLHNQGNSYNKGHKDSEETRLRKSIASKNYYKTHEHPLLGKHLSEETKRKISDVKREYYKTHEHAMKGIPRSEECKLKIGKSKTSTGFLNVCLSKSKRYTQGFYYRYLYYNEGKRASISAPTLEKLKEKVLAKGLVWKRLDEVTL